MVNRDDALRMAYDRDLDLVEINPTNRPPICKIMDYGRYKYDLSKKQKEQKAKQKEIELKEIRLTAKIGEHDLSYKAEQAKDFLNKSYKLKVSMRLRGRENIFADKAINIFHHFADLAGFAYENPPRKLGNVINANVAGVKDKVESK